MILMASGNLLKIPSLPVSSLPLPLFLSQINLKKHCKMSNKVGINTCLATITLNVSGLNIPIKRCMVTG